MLGFIIGLFIGVNLGALMMCLFAANSYEKGYKDGQRTTANDDICNRRQVSLTAIDYDGIQQIF